MQYNVYWLQCANLGFFLRPILHIYTLGLLMQKGSIEGNLRWQNRLLAERCLAQRFAG
jgi:hypothetical protein